MKTHIDNTIEEIQKEFNEKFPHLKSIELVDGVTTVNSKVWDFIEQKLTEQKAQSKRYADERVRQFAMKLENKVYAAGYRDFNMNTLVCVFVDKFRPLINRELEEFLNQNTESNEDKERDSVFSSESKQPTKNSGGQ